MNGTRGPKVREPAWLTAAADQRIARFNEALGGADFFMKFDILQMTLTEPDESAEGQAAFDRWDHSCDNCGKYMPKGLVCRTIERQLEGVKAVITVGACPLCWELP